MKFIRTTMVEHSMKEKTFYKTRETYKVIKITCLMVVLRPSIKINRPIKEV